MRILIVSAVFYPEPVVSAMISRDIAESLSDMGHDVTVLSPKPTRPNGKKYEQLESVKGGYKHIVLDSYTHPDSNFIGRMRESLAFGRATAKYVQTHLSEIDVIYANTWPILGQYILVKTANKRNIPIVLHIQDVYPESMLRRLGVLSIFVKRPLLMLDRLICKMASKVVVISDNMKELFCKTRNVTPEKLIVVRNWQNVPIFDGPVAEPNDKFTFMFVGSISPAAGVPLLLKAFVKANINNTRLVIAGDGSDKNQCLEYAAQNPTFDIEFIPVSPETAVQTQARADVLLLPLCKGISHTASPSKLPAYMFSAKPIIASVDIGSDVEMIITKSNCGWICPPENIEALSSKMIEVSDLSKDVLSELGLNARDYSMQYFTKEVNIDIITSNILKMYDDKTN